MTLEPGRHDAVPMFPLGTVLLPSALLPLHLFEPRYLAMISDCIATRSVPDTVEGLLAAARSGDEAPDPFASYEESRPFGVVLIERGSEVGGDDSRLAVGCLAQILQARQLDDGRWHVVAVGTRRFTVLEWLDDAPYPRADIEVLPEAASADGDRELLDLATTRFAEIDELARKLERGGLPDAEIAEDPALASFQLAALGPLGPLDRYRVLAAEGPAERLATIESLFAAIAADLRSELDP